MLVVAGWAKRFGLPISAGRSHDVLPRAGWDFGAGDETPRDVCRTAGAQVISGCRRQIEAGLSICRAIAAKYVAAVKFVERAHIFPLGVGTLAAVVDLYPAVLQDRLA